MSVALAIQEELGAAHARYSTGARVVRLRDGSAAPVADRRGPASRSSSASRRAMRAEGPARDAIVDLLRCYVVAHIARRLEIGELVALTGVSESTVRRAVYAETGDQLAQFIANIRLAQAHAWLSTNRESRSVTQIAAALGYDSAAAFSRGYRRRYGETMSQTRRRAVNNFELSSRYHDNNGE